MSTFEIESTRTLSEHDKVLQAVLDFFYKFPGVAGCFLSGSVAINEMDEDSDLDIGILFQSADDPERSWQKRWKWKIASWFHRFDADHIKPYFAINFFEPQIQTDINFHILKMICRQLKGAIHSCLGSNRSIDELERNAIRTQKKCTELASGCA